MSYDFLYNGTIAMIIDEVGRDHMIDMDLVNYYIAEGKYTVKVEGLEKHFKEMVKMSVLADCLKKIVNAEKAGKRQVNI